MVGVAGVLALDYVKLATLEDPEQHLLAFFPVDPTTAIRLPQLTAATTEPPATRT